MFVRVVPATKSPGISDGLTYSSDAPLPLGTLVEVPLRSGVIEGIVVEQLPDQSLPFAVKPVTRVIGGNAVVTEALVKTGLWMAKEYLSPLRQVLSVLLPAPPWRLLSTESRSKKTAGKKTKEFVSSPVTLTEEQKQVCDSLLSSRSPALLMGLPGTGKTEVVRALTEHAVKNGGQVIVLSPEILVSEHAADRFAGIVRPERIAVIHSKLTPAKKKAFFRAMLNGDIDLVIGSRTALFSPLPRLSLIAIEEEHEWTYKHEQMPRYNTRDVARVLAREASALLVLSSATPSLESFALASKGDLRLLELKKRYGDVALPAVSVVDLREARLHDTYPLSPFLLTEIGKRLDAREQTVLFLNRAGDYSGLLCLDCKSRINGTDSALCPKCGSTRLISTGAGTQVVERVLKKSFPDISIIRADQDAAKDFEKLSASLKDFASGTGDVLLGTQTVTQGLDFPRVTLSAVLIADTGLSRPDFRAGERVFAHLVQLAGRSGRSMPGEVILQAFNPAAGEVTFAKTLNVQGFLAQEMALRQAAGYPPFVRMCRLLFVSPQAEADARVAEAKLKSAALQAGMTVKISRQKKYDGSHQVLIRGSDIHRLLSAVRLDRVSIDMDPVDIV